MKNFSSYRAYKQLLRPTPTPKMPNFNCNSPPFLIERRAKNDYFQPSNLGYSRFYSTFYQLDKSVIGNEMNGLTSRFANY